MSRLLRLALASSVLLACATGVLGCAAEASDADADVSAGASTAASAKERDSWIHWVKTELAPRLRAQGMTDDKIKRVVFWGAVEGIYTVESNTDYGQHGGPQSPLSFSNCKDDERINSTTALPSCRGMWQVGIAGLIVRDNLPGLASSYRAVHGTRAPSSVAREVLPRLDEPDSVFPADVDIETVAANPRLASVVMREPVLAFYMEQHDAWLAGPRPWLGIPHGYSHLSTAFVRGVWARIDAIFAEP